MFDIESYIIELKKNELEFNNSGVNFSSSIPIQKEKNYVAFLLFLIRSLFDYFQLILKLIFSNKFSQTTHFVYTSKNFCFQENGKFEDRVVSSFLNENVVFINQGKEEYISKINNQKVYNIGGAIVLLGLFFRKNKSKELQNYRSYAAVNNSIVKHVKNATIYTLCYYDINGLSLAFSKYRKNFTYIEVQHGSMINYPPYLKPSAVKLIDEMYVRNNQTIRFLKMHLHKLHDIKYHLIPYPTTRLHPKKGIHILYASTMEMNGFHPVFLNFLEKQNLQEVTVIVRLHPREKEKKAIFENEIKKYKVNYQFDNSKNWLENNTISNLIVVSPWSSIIEEAVDNGFKTIIIDEVGKKRYLNYLDNTSCVYSENLMFCEFIK